ncbi:MAG: phospholipid carrier-dependent glycosyltransferase [Deltaproteobacteria bacterium]|nr:phospholipid carrier-dependent glycosyltransferase [Deltaproteobacteria bacterium]
MTILIFACLSVIYLYRIDQPGVQIWDEQHYIPAAQSYLQGDKETYRNLRNPPLGKELITLSIRSFGDTFFAYRLPSALAAAALGALLFGAGLWLSGFWEGGLLSLLLWLSSTLALLHARLAMVDMATALFFFAGLASFLPILKNPTDKNSTIWLLIACSLAALGGSVKVLDSVLFPIFAIGLFAVREKWPLFKSLPRLAIFAALTSGITLLVTYGILGYSPGEIPDQFRKMFGLQSFLHKDYAGLSQWYDWFLGRGQLWYLAKLGEDGRRFGALCIQNPVLWTVGSLATLALLFRGLFSKRPLDLVLGLSIPIQVLFWVIFKEQKILTYGLPMEPSLCLNTSYALSQWVPRRYYRVWAFCLAAGSLLYFWRALPEVGGGFFP